MNLSRRRDIADLPLRVKGGVCASAAILHVVLYLALYPMFGRAVGSFGVVLVAITTVLFGTLIGLASVVVVLALNVGLATLFISFSLEELLRETNWPGVAALFGMALVVGQLQNLSRRLRVEIDHRRQAEKGEVEERALAEALRSIGGALTASVDLDEIMTLILDNIWRVVPHDAANIMIIEGRIARVTAQRGYKERGLEQEIMTQRLRVDDLPSFRKIVNEGVSLHIPDVSADPNWVVLHETGWIASFIAAPIIVDGKVIGVINLDSMTRGFFRKEDVQRLEVFANQAAIAIRNARFVGMAREKVNRLELISQISRRTTSILDLDKLLQDAARTISDLFGYYMTVIWLVEDDLLFVRAHSSESVGPLDELPPLKIGEQGFSGWVAAHGEPLLVADAKADPRYIEISKPRATRSELVVPMRIQGVTIGVLDVQSDQLGAFAEIDITTMQTVADQLAIGIQNARLYERIQKRQRYLEALHRVSRTPIPERSAVRYMQAVTDSLHEQFNYSRVLMMLGDDQTRELRVAAISGHKSNMTDGERRAYRQRYSTGILGRVITTGKPYLTRDTSQDRHFINPSSGVEILSELAVPVQRNGKTVGVLTVQSDRKDNFDELDLEVMVEVGEQLGINLENVELDAELKHHAEELEKRVAKRTAELEDAKERLEELDKMKSKFVADVSHELRIPVTNLNLYIDLLDRGAEERRDDYIRVFREQVGRLGTLIESILNLSRLELTRTRAQFEPVNLNEIIQPIIDAYSSAGADTPVKLIFEPGEKLPEVPGEADQLMQAVNHLVANAVRYTQKGEVRLSTSVDQKKWQVKLTVQDTGMGIAPEDMPHVFERFYRGNGAAQSDIPGAGLGLAITHEIVNLHNGEIEIESTPGKGTTVTVTLPMKKMG